jgi:hypothetical protein
MSDHMLDVQLAEREAAGGEMPLPEQLPKIRDDTAATFVPYCVKQVLQPTYECWMAAQSRQEFDRCAGGESPPSP